MKTGLVFGLVLATLVAIGQDIIIQPPLITPFECTEFYKLYTGMVTNFSQETFHTRMHLEVDYTSPSGNTFRLADGTLSSSPSTPFSPGNTSIDNVTYQNIFTNRNITFYDKELEALITRTQCLPPGQYDVCLTLFDVNEAPGSSKFLTQTCYTREKQMLTSLLLVSPFENEEIKTDMPLFTWTPVTPFNPRAVYRIQMVEVLANQTAFEAFRSNPIFFEQTGLASNIFQYPVAARTMLPCTRYAWRVTYELAGGFGGTAFKKAPDFLQESEIWEFSRPCEEEEEEVEVETEKPDLFIKPSASLSSQIHVITEPKLFLEIDNPYQEMSSMDILLKASKGAIRKINCCLQFALNKELKMDGEPLIIAGKNYLALDLKSYNLMQNDFYTLIIKNFKSDLFVNFQYKNDDE